MYIKKISNKKYKEKKKEKKYLGLPVVEEMGSDGAKVY